MSFVVLKKTLIMIVGSTSIGLFRFVDIFSSTIISIYMIVVMDIIQPLLLSEFLFHYDYLMNLFLLIIIDCLFFL